MDQDQEFWFGHTQREKREEREERAHVEERREEREGEKLVCVTKPKFLVMVHTSVSLTQNPPLCVYIYIFKKCVAQPNNTLPVIPEMLANFKLQSISISHSFLLCKTCLFVLD